MTYKSLLVLFSTFITTVSCFDKSLTPRNCDRKGVLFYNDLGCAPRYHSNASTCPDYFLCTHFGLLSHFCVFQNDLYKPNEEVASIKADTTCDQNCQCTELVRGNRSAFICDNKNDCPDDQRNLPKNYYYTYSLGKCCSTGTARHSIQSLEKTCNVNGTLYPIGMKFYPLGTCLECLCTESFDGSLQSVPCQPRSCNVQLSNSVQLEQNCAPVYYKPKSLCCPDDFLCSKKFEEFHSSGPKLGPNCTYLDRQIRPRDGLVAKMKMYHKTVRVSCRCDLPPLLTCKLNI